MDNFRFTLPATLLAFAVSASAFAADVEGLPGEETEGRQVEGQCLGDLRAFDKKLADVGFGVLPPGDYGMAAPSTYPGYYSVYGMAGTPRQKIYALRDAAYVYALDDDEQSCQRVLDSMRVTYEKHQILGGIEADDPDQRVAWRRAHIQTARPVTQMSRLMRADTLIGGEIRTANDEKLGEIEDVVLDPEKQDIAYVLASRGGFLGIGEKLVAIRWKDLRATADHELYVLNTAQSAFERAPTVDRSNFDKTTDSGWRKELDRFWDENLEQ